MARSVKSYSLGQLKKKKSSAIFLCGSACHQLLDAEKMSVIVHVRLFPIVCVYSENLKATNRVFCDGPAKSQPNYGEISGWLSLNL